MTPAVGEQLVVPSGLPRNLEAALQRYGTASFKANVATVLDPNGKLSNSLNYGKLLLFYFMDSLTHCFVITVMLMLLFFLVLLY